VKKEIEKNLFKEVEIIGNEIRNQSVPIIKRLSKITNNFDHNDKLLQCLLCTKRDSPLQRRIRTFCSQKLIRITRQLLWIWSNTIVE